MAAVDLAPAPASLAQPEFINVATSARSRGLSLPRLLIEACARHAHKPAFTNLGHSLSYGDIDRLSADLAAQLRAPRASGGLGLQSGERIAIMLPNLLQFPIVLLAALRADLVVVLVNPLYTARELAHQLADSGASALVVLANFGHVAQRALEGSAVREVLVTQVGDLLPWPKSVLVNVSVRRIRKLVPDFDIPGSRTLRSQLRAGRSQPRVASQAGALDIAQLQYTGGTTGLSKGAALSHAALIANTSAAEKWLGRLVDPERDSALICLPLYHIAAYANMLYTWSHGVHGVLVTNPRDIPGLVRALDTYRPALFSGVNTLFDALMNDPGFTALDWSHVRLCVQGGTALRRATAERWKQLTGKDVVEMYGLSETCAGITANRWDAPNPVGSIGLPLPGVEVSLRDEHGAEVGADDIGELCVRGAQVTSGYWQRPGENAEAFFEGGWFRTGDIARRDADGYLFLLDRRKDMILVSGFNVFPNEIEDVVSLHPGVLEAAAVGVPDEKCGEAVKLVVVRRDPALDEAAVRAHCRQHLTGYKQPTLVEFRDSLPKSAVGKVLRRELR